MGESVVEAPIAALRDEDKGLDRSTKAQEDAGQSLENRHKDSEAGRTIVQSARSAQTPYTFQPRERRPLMERVWREHHAFVRGAVSIVVALVLWEAIARTLVTNKLILAPLSTIFMTALRLWKSGELPQDMAVSFSALGLGFGIAALVGVAVGSVIGVSIVAREHLNPLINALYATPLVALSPILILSLGIGLASKVAIVFLMSVFPILINTAVGIQSTDDKLIEAARSFAADRLQIFRRVLLPSALPFIIAGLRLGVGRGLVGIFIGELFGANQGIGYLISLSSQSFDLPGMFVGVLVLAITGVLSVSLFEALERAVAPWRFHEAKG
jgi:NitT/TauT family transport system permease protein